MNENINVDVEKLKPFTRFIYTIGELPSSYLMSMTYEEQLVWLCNYLAQTVIPTVNNNGQAVEELQNLYLELQDYVNHYFDNLDVQDEINKKLDDMVLDGSLGELISVYVQPTLDEQNATIQSFQNQINALESGSPLAASSTSGMTDTTRIYVNTTDGYWYYYNGTAWTQGGVYQETVLNDEYNNELEMSYKLYKGAGRKPSASQLSPQTINASGGIVGGRTNRFRTPRMTTNADRGAVAILNNPTYQMYATWYSSDEGTTEEWPDYFITQQDEWVNRVFMGLYDYCALVFRKADNSDLDDSDKTAILNALSFYTLTDKTLTIPLAIPDSKEVGDRISTLESNIGYNSKTFDVSLFRELAVCGGSFDNGYYYTGEAESPITNNALSWLSCLARKNGVNATNYAVTSINTYTYLTNTNGLPKVLNDSAKDLYILTFGGNDASQLGSSYLGTVADITDDYTQNPNTFYGNYARIIEQIQAHAPKAKIVLGMWYIPNLETQEAVRLQFFNASKEIATHYSLPYIEWKSDSWITSNEFKNNIIHGHPSVIEFTGIANAFERIFSKAVSDNISYFKDYTE